ncbi:MAG: MotA/TolQ/ExbB proton channel family protein, partial [Candidatus Poribacteria bacterium]|nr:MotA/TolQ/ExbB proton channel family protein [Candidatus Poribacteria bacterium]
GVLGTLLGLVMMMRSLDSSHPELMTSLGTGMGTALLSIFYGVLLSNFLFTPVAVKIENRAAQRVVLMEIIMEGIILLINEVPTGIIRDKLQAFLAFK